MQKAQRAVGPLKVLLVLAFAALLLAQAVVLPSVFGRLAEDSPEQAYLRWPMLTLSVVVLLCVQVVIVCTWQLLTMVRDDRIFSEDSLACLVAGWGLSGLPALLLLLLVGGAVLGLL